MVIIGECLNYVNMYKSLGTKERFKKTGVYC
jgi:hypothetical protein